jgi:hypothetical protein
MTKVSIGLQAFLREMKQPMARGIQFSSSKAGSVLSFNHVAALANAVLEQDNMPSELCPITIPSAPLHIQSAIRDRLNANAYIIGSYDKDNSPFFERNLTAQTVQNQLVLAFSTLLTEKRITDVDMAKMANFGELNFSAALRKKDVWWQANGQADFTLSSSIMLPPQSTPIGATFDEHENEQLLDWANRTIRKEETLPDGFKFLRKGAMPYFVAGLQLYGKDLRYPAMNICVEYKKLLLEKNVDAYVSQCGMYLLTSSIAYAKLRNCDKPFMVAGAVTDGYRYTFLAFQLNTLDFDSTTVRNVFWRKDMRLFDNINKKFSNEAWVQLKELLAYPMKLNVAYNKK